MVEMFSYEFIRNAFLAGILASICGGIIGSIVVSKRLVSLSGGIAHAAFGGVGLGYLLKINPSLGALAFAVISSLGIGAISRKAKQTEDTSIAIIWSLGMSIGIICIGLARGYAPDLFTYLFGNILAVSSFDLWVLTGLTVFILGAVVICYKEIVALCFDEQFMHVRGFKVFPLYLFIMLLVAITVVILMKIVGIILIIALLSLPSATARFFSKTLKSMMVISVGGSMVFISGGLILSYRYDLPSGATIIILAVVIFALTSFIVRLKKRRS